VLVAAASAAPRLRRSAALRRERQLGLAESDQMNRRDSACAPTLEHFFLCSSALWYAERRWDRGFAVAAYGVLENQLVSER